MQKTCFVIGMMVYFISTLTAQNTIGLLSHDAAESVGGYNLIYPERQTVAYLIDECGQVVHLWADEDQEADPGSVAYLLPDGRLLRAKVSNTLITENSFGTGGTGGVVQLLSWDNTLEWTYIVADTINRQHHDVHPMPNGNVLILAFERFFLDDVMAAGFDTLSNAQRTLWSEQLLEVDPTTDSIVWEWHLWDHLVQQHDSTKLNYGLVSEHPERVDLNYTEFTFTRDDWIHANAIDYNESLDQIMISARNFNEIWIIDHSTTTEEAASSSGGNSGRGGDLLWRWGSPMAYQQGDSTDQKLYYNHDAQWVDDFVDPSHPYYGQVAVFNNFINFDLNPGRSFGQLIDPVWNPTTQQYEMQDDVFLPKDFSATFVHPDTARNFSSAASSIQIIGDGHVVMCAGRQGRSFELNPEGEVVWEYLTPLRFGQPFPQGSTLNTSENFTFQVERYPADYSAFIGRSLNPIGYIELEPNEGFCGITNTETPSSVSDDLRVYPNPVTDQLYLQNLGAKPQTTRIVNALGQTVWTSTIAPNTTSTLKVATWQRGVYWLRTSDHWECVILQ